MAKTRLNISLDQDLATFIKVYAQENRTTVADIVTQYMLALKRQADGDSMDIIFSNPDFHMALVEMKEKLKNGSAEWYTFEDVFTNG